MMIKYGWLGIVLVFAFAGCFGCAQRDRKQSMETVEIVLERKAAKEVFFFSSLYGFNPRAADKTPDGAWKVTVPANLEFRYFFIIDGAHFLPDCSFKERDDFGNQNCIFISGR